MNAKLESLEHRRLLSAVGPAQGSLDPSFGVGGTATLHVAERLNSPREIVTLPGGKQVILARLFTTIDVGPYSAILRINSDGSLDTTFGDNGVAPTSASMAASSMTLSADGHILVVGETAIGDADLFLQRLNSDGSIDTAFGNGGAVRTDTAGRDDVAVKVLEQPDGRIIVAGYEQKTFIKGSLQLPDVTLVRYLTDGQLDTTFGQGGIVVRAVAGYQAAIAASAALQSDGKIVVAGNVVQTEGDGFLVQGSEPHFLAMRFNGNGNLDRFFARGGAFVSRSAGYAADVAITSRAKILIAGTTTTTGRRFAALQLRRNGAVDGAFGPGGIATTSFSALTGATSDDNDVVSRVLQQNDGKIVLVGTADDAGIALARFLSNGRIDRSFGAAGKVFTEASPTTIATAATQADGKLSVAGLAGADMLLAQYVSYTGGISGSVLEITSNMSLPLGPISGWNVYLDSNHNGRADRNEPVAITDESGRYSFTNLTPGIYHVAQVIPRGWRPAPHTLARKNVRVTPATTQESIDFAVVRKLSR